MSSNVKVVVWGFAIWFIVLLVVRALGAVVFSEGNPWLVVAYIACFPLGVAFTYVMRAVLGLPMREMLSPMAILAVIAIMMDGFAFGFTKFYGVGEHELYAAAFLLWAPGVFLLCALWIIDRAAKAAQVK